MAEDKKAWTDLQKFETLLYMFDTLTPSPEWKKLDDLPYGRNLNTVKKMVQRERERIKKEKGGDTPAKKDDTTSDAEGKKPKAGARKRTSALKSGSGDESDTANKTKAPRKGIPALKTIDEDEPAQKGGTDGEVKAKAKAPKKPRATKTSKDATEGEGEGEKEKTTKKRKAPAKKDKTDSSVEGPPAKQAKVADSAV